MLLPYVCPCSCFMIMAMTLFLKAIPSHTFGNLPWEPAASTSTQSYYKIHPLLFDGRDSKVRSNTSNNLGRLGMEQLAILSTFFL
ncbi:hypothetical protein Peur_071724 [Populus x canadensis]